MSTAFSISDMTGFSNDAGSEVIPFSTSNIVDTVGNGSISLDTSISVLKDINQIAIGPYTTEDTTLSMAQATVNVKFKRTLQPLLSDSTTSLLNISNENGIKLLEAISYINNSSPPILTFLFKDSSDSNIIFPLLYNTVNTTNEESSSDICELICTPVAGAITEVTDYPAMPENITNASIMPLSNGGVILIGGKNSSGTAVNTIYQLLPNSTDGSLEWSLSSYTLPVALYDMVIVNDLREVKAISYETVEKAIILIGGNTGSAVVDTIYIAPYSLETGLTGAFTASSVTFPVPITKAYAYVDPDGNIIVAGGTDGTTDYDSVYYATDAADYNYTTLNLGSFTAETYTLPFSGATLGAIGNNNTLYLTNNSGTPGSIYYYFDSSLSSISAPSGTLTNNLPNLSDNGTLHVLNDVLIYAGDPSTSSSGTYDIYMSNISYSTSTLLNSNSEWITVPVSISTIITNLFAYQFFDSNFNPNLVIAGLDTSTGNVNMYSFNLVNNLTFSIKLITTILELPLGFYLPSIMYLFNKFSNSSSGAVTIPPPISYSDYAAIGNSSGTSYANYTLYVSSQNYNPTSGLLEFEFLAEAPSIEYGVDPNNNTLTLALGGLRTGDEIVSIEAEIYSYIFDPLVSVPADGASAT